MNRLRYPAWSLLFACCVLPAQRSPADDLLPGRLFHSPAERAALDGHRPQRVAVSPPTPPATGKVRPPSPERSPELSGFVLRSDGRNSYWLAVPNEPLIKR